MTMTTSVKMVFWDVQHGHATYIKSPNGKHIVIDLGIGDYSGNNSSFSPLQHLKYNYSVNQLDQVIITHPHLDHIDDIFNFSLLNPRVLQCNRSIPDDKILKGVRDCDKPKYLKFIEIRNNYTNPVSDQEKLEDPNNWGGMKVSTFSPWWYDGENLNNYSIITVVEYAGIKIVIPGDNEKVSLDRFMELESFKAAVRNAYILLAPHHGRESGYNSDFVSLVNPSLTIVSDGKYCDTSANNRYSQKSTGWKVYKNGTSSDRKCLTTNSDGEVFVEFGYDNEERFLSVNI